MPAPQPGIFATQTAHHHFLEYKIDPASDIDALKNAIRSVLALADDENQMVMSFGAALWDRLSPAMRPAALEDFSAIDGGTEDQRAPSTQRDFFIWLRNDVHADILDLAVAIHQRLSAVAKVELDLPGFVYRDSRDLIGFVDGTANPKDDARFDAALIPDGDAGAGGAYVFSQKWVHDLGAFNALGVDEQEKVVGRTKTDDIELEGDAMPPDSHVSRTDVKIDGVAQKIFRRSAPFGTAGEHGLYFPAFACEPARIQVQLDRMYGVSSDGRHDRLVAFSRAVTGSYWYAPDKVTLAGI